MTLNKNLCPNSNPLIPPNALQTDLPLLLKLSEAYKLWHKFLTNLPRHTRFTIGSKIDNLFVDCLELALFSGYAARDKRPDIVRKLSAKFDALKFFLKLLWEIKGLNDQKYTSLSQELSSIGKMIGGWQNLLRKYSC